MQLSLSKEQDMKTLLKIVKNVEKAQSLIVKSYGWRLTLVR